MYSNTINCYKCDKPLPVDETITVDPAELGEVDDENEAEIVYLCEDCYFGLDFEEDGDEDYEDSEP